MSLSTIHQQMERKQDFKKECRFDKCKFEGLDEHDCLFINQNNRQLFKHFDELIYII